MKVEDNILFKLGYMKGLQDSIASHVEVIKVQQEKAQKLLEETDREVNMNKGVLDILKGI